MADFLTIRNDMTGGVDGQACQRLDMSDIQKLFGDFTSIAGLFNRELCQYIEKIIACREPAE